MNFLKAYYDKLNESYDAMVKVAREVSEDAMSLTKSVLLECKNLSIELDENNIVSVPYDGGNHPEYASNCFSRVSAVYLNDGNILYDCEDSDGLWFSDLRASEQASVAYAVYQQYLDDIN